MADEESANTLSVVPMEHFDPGLRAAIIALCTRAFAQDFGNLFGFVPDSRHLLAYHDGVLIGHACWETRQLQPEGRLPLRTGYVNAVAVKPALHGHCVGSVIIARVNAALQRYDLGGLSTPRVSYYTRLGWERWTGPTAARSTDGLVPTPDDTVMLLRTPTTPPLDTTTLLIADWRVGQPW